MMLQTERLGLRELTREDFAALCKILQDPITMTAYAHAFPDEEVWEWLERQQRRYREGTGWGLWAVVLLETGELIGQCGLTMQECEGRIVPEIGYLFRRDCWHQGYAIEAASACRDYAFGALGLDEVYSLIRDNNFASQQVAKRNGMTERGVFVKHYYGIDMPHLIFSVRKGESGNVPSPVD